MCLLCLLEDILFINVSEWDHPRYKHITLLWQNKAFPSGEKKVLLIFDSDSYAARDAKKGCPKSGDRQANDVTYCCSPTVCELTFKQGDSLACLTSTNWCLWIMNRAENCSTRWQVYVPNKPQYSVVSIHLFLVGLRLFCIISILTAFKPLPCKLEWAPLK